MSDRIITRAELAKHNNQKDGRWILIGNDVLDISTFHGKFIHTTKKPRI